MLDAVPIHDGTNVLEIGPGAGVMTAMMAARGARVVAVEIDRHLQPVLESVLSGYENVTVRYEDILKADLPELIETAFSSAPYILVANLPYYITTAVLERMFALASAPESICVMVQEETSRRILAQPGEKQWCLLSAQAAWYGDGRILRNVPRAYFEPQPHVDSCFLCLERHADPPAYVSDEQIFRKTVQAAFMMRRKTLLNNLRAAFSLTRDEAERILASAGLPPGIRGEALNIRELADVSNVLAGSLHSR